MTPTIFHRLFLLLLLLGAVVANENNNNESTSLIECIQQLKEIAQKTGISLEMPPYNCDLFFLRFCAHNDDALPTTVVEMESVEKAFQETLEWRSRNQNVLQAARNAVHDAMMGNKRKVTSFQWDNTAVAQYLPHSHILGDYVTPRCMLTLATSEGDLLYCIKPSQFNDKQVMSLLSVDEMVDFFIFVKEMHMLVLQAKHLLLLKDNNNNLAELKRVITLNDLTGTRGGMSSPFKKALKKSSELTKRFYPKLNGPTILLNLPRWMSGLANFFMPSSASKKIMFLNEDITQDIEDLRLLDRVALLTRIEKSLYPKAQCKKY